MEVCNEVAGLFCQIGTEVPVFLAGSSGLRETGLSFSGFPMVGVPELRSESSPGYFRRSESSGLMAGSSGPGKNLGKKMTKSFVGTLTGGVPELSTGNFRLSGSSGLMARSSGPEKFLGRKWLSLSQHP